MRILRFGSVLGFASTVRFYHGFLNGLLMTSLGYETTQWNAWLNWKVPESSYILAPWPLSLLSIVKVGRVPDLRVQEARIHRDFEMAV